MYSAEIGVTSRPSTFRRQGERKHSKQTRRIDGRIDVRVRDEDEHDRDDLIRQLRIMENDPHAEIVVQETTDEEEAKFAKCVRLMLDAGARCVRKNEYGKTSLHACSRVRHGLLPQGNSRLS